MTAGVSTAIKYLTFAPQGAWLTLRYLAGASKGVWLTFDDGPHAPHTEMILDVLERRSIRATFFVIGARARETPHLVRRAFEAGHRIGNHSFTHPDLTKLTPGAVREEIARTEEVIGPYLGREKIFRPPYGARNADVDAVAAELGYRTILWNVDTRDWSEHYQPNRWVRRGASRVRFWEDSRLLLHDDRRGTAENMEAFLERVERLGTTRFMSPDTL